MNADAIGFMRVIHNIDELRAALKGVRPAFVPTMGALHEGHLALIRKAVVVSRPTIVSIFVNPTQFGPNEDFARYPRRLDADVHLAAAAGTDIVFAPSVEAMYPASAKILAPSLPVVATQPQLEEAHRPTHFAGVCQVVARLFDLVQPVIAIFGEKDYQQLLVLKSMAEQEYDRWPGLQVVAHPIVRESDGLAMSSRNMYLQPADRPRALGLIGALSAANQFKSDSERSPSTPAEIEGLMRDRLQQCELEIDYAVIRDAATLLPLSSWDRPARALIAARLGPVRLIDNLQID